MGLEWQHNLQVCQNKSDTLADIPLEFQRMHVTCYNDCAKGWS